MTAKLDFLLRRPFAHRGLHDRQRGLPENSRAAFRAAIDAGYGIELDIQLSLDGQAMVFHDYDLSRLTNGSGAVRQKNASDLQSHCFLGSQETIPTLAQVLELVAGRAPLLVEIKGQDVALGPDTCGLEAAVATDLANYTGDVAVMSFNPHSVGNFSRLLPHRPRGLVTSDFSDSEFALTPADVRNRLMAIPDLETVRANFISHDVKDLERPRVREIRESGVPVLSWTIKSQSSEAQARQRSDNITFEGYLPDNFLS